MLFFIDIVAVYGSVSISVVFIFVIVISIVVGVSVGVGYCRYSKISVNILCTVINVNIVAYICETVGNVTKYVIILIYVIIGVGGGDGGQ